MARTVGTLRLTLSVTKRWYFRPLLIGMVALGRLGIIKDIDKAAEWFARHAFVIKTSDGGRVNL